MPNVFFISDPHLGHAKVAELRGFESTSKHDATFCAQWSKYVRPYDQVWVLGDLAASNPTYALTLINCLPGEKHLISGNHDKCHPMHRDAHNRQAQYLEVFASVQPFARRKVAGKTVLLSHFPYETDHTDEVRHTQYRLRNQGEFLLHGHTHSLERYTSSIEMHVGVDAWDMSPVPFDEVEAWVINQSSAIELGYPELYWTENVAA